MGQLLETKSAAAAKEVSQLNQSRIQQLNFKLNFKH
jgi:hypothetical protein